MEFQIECLSGWRPLYQPIVDACVAAGVEIMLIKEKFGGLDIRVRPPSSQPIRVAIREARIKSMTMCEVCGQPGEPHAQRGWVKTLCDPHAVEFATRGLDHYR